MVGQDFVAGAAKGISGGVKVAYCPDPVGIGIDPEIEAVCHDAALALKEAGAEVEVVALDLSAGRDAFLALRGLWFVMETVLVGVRAPQEGDVQRALELDVVHEERAAGQEPRVCVPQDPLTDQAWCHRRASPAPRCLGNRYSGRDSPTAPRGSRLRRGGDDPAEREPGS